MMTSPTTTVRPGSAGRFMTLARHPHYAAARSVVDQLSDAQFPIQHTRIVGVGVRSVETVTGRLTVARAALYGGGTGAWLGLFIALLFGIFTIGPGWFGVLLTTVLIGAVFGAVAGALGRGAIRSSRTFASLRSLEADAYEVQVAARLYEEALRLVSAPSA